MQKKPHLMPFQELEQIADFCLQCCNSGTAIYNVEPFESIGRDELAIVIPYLKWQAAFLQEKANDDDDSLEAAFQGLLQLSRMLPLSSEWHYFVRVAMCIHVCHHVHTSDATLASRKAALECVEMFSAREFVPLFSLNMSWEMLRAELRKENVQQGFELWDELFEDKKRISQQVLEELRSLATPSFNSYINTTLGGATVSDSCEASSLDLSSSFCRLESGSRRCPFYTALWDHTRTEMQRSSNLLHNTRSVLLLNHIFNLVQVEPPTTIMRVVMERDISGLLHRRKVLRLANSCTYALERLLGSLHLMQSSPRPWHLSTLHTSRTILEVADNDEFDHFRANTITAAATEFTSHYRRRRYKNVLKNTVIACTNNIWIQVDGEPNRLVRANDIRTKPFANAVSSTDAGTFTLSVAALSWSERPIQDNNTNSTETQGGGGNGGGGEGVLHLPYTCWEKLVYGTLMVSASPTVPSIPEAGARPTSNKASAATLSDKVSCRFIGIHIGGRVFKFFPFMPEELRELLKALSDLSGLNACEVNLLAASLNVQNTRVLRHQVLLELLQERGPGAWINHTKPLATIVEALTSSYSPPRLRDMELLYHSCRTNRSVFIEAVGMLRNRWLLSSDENSRLKILSVVERLLDGGVTHGNDDALHDVLTWLRQVEEDLNPARDVHEVRMLTSLRKLSDKLIHKRIRTFSQADAATIFARNVL